jgi:GxxExxY protein
LDPLIEQVLNAVFEVQNTLGAGFLEKIYERALLRELKLRNIEAVAQPQLRIQYKDEEVGLYQPDILVKNELLVELKCVGDFAPEHTAQCLNYLKATGLTICLLINFQKPRVQWKRIVRNYIGVNPRESAAKS